MSEQILCIGCVHYEFKGIQRGQRTYSACNVHGEKVLAMEERKSGPCGPNATLKEDE